MDNLFDDRLVNDIMLFKNEQKRSSNIGNIVGSLGSLDKGVSGNLYQFMDYDESKD